MSVDEVS